MKKRKENSARNKINGQFAPRTIEMLSSPAMRVLSKTGRRILDRIEIELAAHGGRDNGDLPITHRDFVAFGIDGHAVGPGTRELAALGLAKIKRGRAGNAEFRRPSLHGLTYRPIANNPPTDKWRRIETVEDAEKIAGKARASASKNPWKSGRRKKIQWGKPPARLLEKTPSKARCGKPPAKALQILAGGNPQYFLEALHLGEGGREP